MVAIFKKYAMKNCGVPPPVHVVSRSRARIVVFLEMLSFVTFEHFFQHSGRALTSSTDRSPRVARQQPPASQPQPKCADDGWGGDEPGQGPLRIHGKDGMNRRVWFVRDSCGEREPVEPNVRPLPRQLPTLLHNKL